MEQQCKCAGLVCRNQTYYRGQVRVCQVASWEHLLVPGVLCFHLVCHFVLDQS